MDKKFIDDAKEEKIEMTIHDTFTEEIVIASKMNDLTLREIDFLYPQVLNTPLLPRGITYIPKKKEYRARISKNGVKTNIASSRNFSVALSAYLEYCRVNMIKP